MHLHIGDGLTLINTFSTNKLFTHHPYLRRDFHMYIEKYHKRISIHTYIIRIINMLVSTNKK